MDASSMEYAMGVFDEIEEALKGIGMSLRRLDASETKGIPSGIITIGEGQPQNDWETVCNVIPTHVEEVSTTFVQLYLPLLPPLPEQAGLLERFAKECNGRFGIGTLLVFQDSLCMKHTIVLEPESELEQSHFQAAVFAFFLHAEQYARKADALLNGRISMEEAMNIDVTL